MKFAKVMFSQVSVCPQGQVSAPGLGVCGRHPPGQTPPPWADRPWADPPGQTPPGQPPLGRHPGQTPPFPSACWDTVNKQVVRIPLECILCCGQKFPQIQPHETRSNVRV